MLFLLTSLSAAATALDISHILQIEKKFSLSVELGGQYGGQYYRFLDKDRGLSHLKKELNLSDSMIPAIAEALEKKSDEYQEKWANAQALNKLAAALIRKRRFQMASEKANEAQAALVSQKSLGWSLGRLLLIIRAAADGDWDSQNLFPFSGIIERVSELLKRDQLFLLNQDNATSNATAAYPAILDAVQLLSLYDVQSLQYVLKNYPINLERESGSYLEKKIDKDIPKLSKKVNIKEDLEIWKKRADFKYGKVFSVNQ